MRLTVDPSSALPFEGCEGSAEEGEERRQGRKRRKEPDQDQPGCDEHRLHRMQASLRKSPDLSICGTCALTVFSSS